LNILVTGGGGFIGSNIADAYLLAGHKVIIIDDMSTGRKQNIPKNAEFVEMDIRDSNLNDLFKDYRINFVNHQAARGDVRGSVENPKEYVDVNIMGGVNLLECCVKNDVNGIIYSSTGGCVYGEPLYCPTDESHPMRPIDPYGSSKASFELYLPVFKQLYNLQYTIFRYPNVYGPRQNPFGEAGVISIFSSRMLKKQKVIINGSGLQERDYVYISDVVKANMMATEKMGNTVYNLSSGIGTNVNKIFLLLKTLIDYKNDPIYGPKKPGEVSRSILSAKKIKKSLNWVPQVTIDYGFQKTVEYIRDSEI